MAGRNPLYRDQRPAPASPLAMRRRRFLAALGTASALIVAIATLGYGFGVAPLAGSITFGTSSGPYSLVPGLLSQLASTVVGTRIEAERPPSAALPEGYEIETRSLDRVRDEPVRPSSALISPIESWATAAVHCDEEGCFDAEADGGADVWTADIEGDGPALALDAMDDPGYPAPAAAPLVPRTGGGAFASSLAASSARLGEVSAVQAPAPAGQRDDDNRREAQRSANRGDDEREGQRAKAQGNEDRSGDHGEDQRSSGRSDDQRARARGGDGRDADDDDREPAAARARSAPATGQLAPAVPRLGSSRSDCEDDDCRRGPSPSAGQRAPSRDAAGGGSRGASSDDRSQLRSAQPSPGRPPAAAPSQSGNGHGNSGRGESDSKRDRRD